MGRKIMPEGYHELAASCGFAWLGPAAARTEHRTNWQCAAGHVFDTSYDSLKYNRSCRFCSNARKGDKNRLSPAAYVELAVNRGLQWLGPEVKRVTTNTNWKCDRGHEFSSSYAYINGAVRNGCRKCQLEDQGERQRHRPEAYHSLAASRGFTWVGPEVVSIHTKTQWQGSCGHTWWMTYGNLSQGQGCPTCMVPNGRGPAFYRAFAAAHGVEWLGPEVRTTYEATQWRCEKGHVFSRSMKLMQVQHRCATCVNYINGRRASWPQLAVHEMVGGQLNYHVGPYCLDIALNRDGVDIAIEYDGWWWHRDKLDADAQRAGDLQRAGWRFLRIKGGSAVPTADELEAAIAGLLAGATYAEIVLDWQDA